MKFLVVFVALFALAVAAPEIEIVRLLSDVQPDGYKTDLELTDGSKAQAVGVLENVGTDEESLSVKGSYSWVGDDGVTYTVNYIADKNGYQPQGAHLPVAPVGV